MNIRERMTQLLGALERNHQKIFILLLVTFWIVNLGLWFTISDNHFHFKKDTMTYVNPGHQFYQTGIFQSEYDEELVPEIRRTPIYPIIIGPFYNEGASWWRIPVFINLMFRFLILIMLLKFPVSINEVVKLFAGFFYILDPLSTLYGFFLLSETLSAFCIFATLFLFFRWYRETCRWPSLVVACLFAGISVLIRPINIILPFIIFSFVGVWLWRQRKEKNWKFISKYLLMVIVSCAIIPMTWCVRNAVYAGAFTITNISSDSLLYYRAAGVLAEKNKEDFSDVQSRLVEEFELIRENENLDQISFANMKKKRALGIIRENPGIYFKNTLHGLFTSIADMGSNEFEGYVKNSVFRNNQSVSQFLSSTLALYSRYFTGFIYLLSFIAFGLSIWKRRHWELLLSIVVISATLLILAAGPEAYHRFRIPILPLLILASALFISFLIREDRRKE